MLFPNMSLHTDIFNNFICSKYGVVWQINMYAVRNIILEILFTSASDIFQQHTGSW